MTNAFFTEDDLRTVENRNIEAQRKKMEAEENNKKEDRIFAAAEKAYAYAAKCYIEAAEQYLEFAKRAGIKLEPSTINIKVPKEGLFRTKYVAEPRQAYYIFGYRYEYIGPYTSFTDYYSYYIDASHTWYLEETEGCRSYPKKPDVVTVQVLDASGVHKKLMEECYRREDYSIGYDSYMYGSKEVPNGNIWQSDWSRRDSNRKSLLWEIAIDEHRTYCCSHNVWYFGIQDIRSEWKIMDSVKKLFVDNKYKEVIPNKIQKDD